MNRHDRRHLFKSQRAAQRVGNAPNVSVIVDNFHGVNWFEKLKVMPCFTIYFNPTDFPGKYVTRLFDGDKPLRLLTVKDTLEEARAAIPQGPPLGFVRFERSPTDDPAIVEAWL